MGITHFSGVTNVAESTTLGTYVAPDPTKSHQFMDDFDKFNNIASVSTGADPTGAADWSLEQTFTAGTPTAVVVQADGGILTLTNGTSDDANSFVRWKGQNLTTVIAEIYRWESTKAMWFKARFKVSDATESDLFIGLQINDTTPLDVTDGLFFIKPDGSTTLTFTAEKNNVASTVATATMVDDTYITVGFAYLPNGDGLGSASPTCNVYLNDIRVGALSTFTNFPDDEDLTISFGIQNGAAAAKSMSIDYLFVAKER